MDKQNLEDMKQNSYNDDERLYLQMMQENITRMANNSANIKTWFITIVSALFAIEQFENINLWLLLLPIVVFWYLDAYYLRIERGLRNRERLFINVKNDKVQNENVLYCFSTLYDKKDCELGYVNCSYFSCLFSSSVIPIYMISFIALIAVAFLF